MDEVTPTRVRLSRRRFLGGAAASAALLTAGGATAVVLKERGGTSVKATTATARPVSSPSSAGLAAASPALEDADVRLRHLLRRTTFTATSADVTRFAGMALPDVTDALIASAGDDDARADAAVAALGYDTTKAGEVVATWVARMMLTQRPMLERMTLFWHGLLTSGLSKVGGKYAGVMLTQNQLFRDHAFDKFDVLLKAVVRDPAMMIWLDVATSKRDKPNENYPRELMELFTLGPGNYSEQDVRESARAHTGYSLEQKTGFVYRPAQHDNTAKTFLGQTGNFDADGIVDIILQQPAAPEHFARKLFEFFAYPNPNAAVIAPIADVAKQSGFDTRKVVRAVLTSDAFYAPEAYRAVVKSPTDFAIGAVRLLETQPDARTVVAACRNMGQTLFDPPNVAGWPGGRTWLGTSTWFARVNASAELMYGGGGAARAQKGAKQGKGFQGPAFRPVDTSAIFAAPPSSAAEAIDVAALATIDGQISSEARATLQEYLDDGGGFTSLPPTMREERLRGLLALLIASPEYQLA